MGKKEKFKRDHPFCCFCGGEVQATTIDHIPARNCFVGRAAPEGFEFPACQHCQSASRLDEILFSFIVKMSDERLFSRPEIDKSVTELGNNLRHLMPNPFLTGIEKRKILRNLGFSKPLDIPSTHLPVLELQPEVSERILRYSRKLSCALYYREQKRIAKKTHRVFAFWGQGTNPADRARFQAFIQMTPSVVKGARPNLEFGDQFVYRVNKASHPDVVATICAFSKGLVVANVIIDVESATFLTQNQAMEGMPSVAVEDIYTDPM